MAHIFSGVGIALATPFRPDYAIDYHSLENLVVHVINGKTDYLVVMGTTAESPTLSVKEQFAVLEFIQKLNTKGLPIILGYGGNNTLALKDKLSPINDLEIDAILSVCPYYNRPSQDGIRRHFEMLADASKHPVVLYNVPARTSSNISAATTCTLSKHENIIAIKEASSDFEQICNILKDKSPHFEVISGDDGDTEKIIKLGGIGVISVLGNLLPLEFSETVHTILSAKGGLNNIINRACELLGMEGNPTSLKTALQVANIITHRTVRLPLFDGSKQLIYLWKELLDK